MDVRALAYGGGSLRAYGVLSPARADLGLGAPAPPRASPAASLSSSLASPFATTATARRPRAADGPGAFTGVDVVGSPARGWETRALASAAARSPDGGGARPAPAPAPAAPPPAAPSLVPSLGGLGAAGYTMEPPAAELRRLSEAALSALAGFCVARAGHGSVRWPGAVDVRGLRLDGALTIEGGAACARARGAGAEPGVEVVAARAPALDRPARVTLFGLEPPPAAAAAAAFEAALRARCAENGSVFVDFEPAEGWRLRFDVPGFSA
jgi:hypothetical protein